MAEESVERSRDLERFLTFIDAIVAIAITLLVLPLVDLATAVSHDHGSVLHFLRENWGDFLSFLLSFLVIARVWLAQHRIVRHLTRTTGAITTLLLTWTLTIVFLPFPTALIAGAPNDPTTKVLYMGALTLSCACLATVCWCMARDRTIRDSDEAPSTTPSVVNGLTFLTALAISLAFPATSYFPLLLLFAADPISSRWDRRVTRGE